MKLYVDGKEVVRETNGQFPQIIKTPAPLRIGVDQNGENGFLGSIRRAAVFRRALTEDEISQRARNENAAVKDAVGDWLLDGKGGASVQPVAGIVRLWRPVAVRGEAPAPGESLSVWHRRPGNRWTEATPIGNGRLGGMVLGGVARETIFLNDDTLWSGEPKDTLNYEAIKYLPKVRELLLSGKEPEAHSLCNAKMLGPWNECYLPLGTLEMESPFQGEAVDYRRDLDLTRAVLRVQFQHDGVKYRREVFASHPAQAIVIRLTGDRPGRINFHATLKSPLRYVTTAENGIVTMKGRAPVHADPHYAGTAVVYEDGPKGRGTRFESRLKVIAEGGTVSSDGNRVKVENADGATLLLVAATSFNGPEKSPSRDGKNTAALCDGYLDGIAGKSYDALLREHVADYQRLFGRVSLDLGKDENDKLPTDERLRRHRPGCDPSLSALYFQFGRYLLISSSRPGTQPANLQGIWNHHVHAIWSSNWTLNCNAQINYWPVEVANLSECHLPLIELTRELSINGMRTAKHYYGTEGWVAHHNADLWRASTPVGGDCTWAMFPCGGAWLCRHLVEHYNFTQDKEYLRSVYPVLKGSALFFVQNLQKERKHGWLVTAPDVNFEMGFVKQDGSRAALCAGPTASMQMVRQLFKDCVTASRTLGVDEVFRAQLEEVLPQLAPMQVSPSTGEIQEWLEDWKQSAPGLCELLSSWGLICSDQITPRGTPDLAAAIRKSFLNRAIWKNGGVGSWQGAFQANAYARLGDGDTALAVLDKQLEMHLNPNLTAHFLDFGAEWEIDGNLGLVAAIAEMLLQSHAGEIELLPALPKAWKNGAVSGLKARGNFAVDIAWKDGKLARATIRAPVGGACKIRYGGTVVARTLANGEAISLGPDLR
jgi:alpha-L-fucosidase 2